MLARKRQFLSVREDVTDVVFPHLDRSVPPLLPLVFFFVGQRTVLVVLVARVEFVAEQRLVLVEVRVRPLVTPVGVATACFVSDDERFGADVDRLLVQLRRVVRARLRDVGRRFLLALKRWGDTQDVRPLIVVVAVVASYRPDSTRGVSPRFTVSRTQTWLPTTHGFVNTV